MTDKGKMLIMMMGKKKPTDEESKNDPAEEKDEPSLSGEGLHAAMDDFLSAVEAKDSSAMAEAFKHAIDLCYDEEEKESPEEEKSEDY